LKIDKNIAITDDKNDDKNEDKNSEEKKEIDGKKVKKRLRASFI